VLSAVALAAWCVSARVAGAAQADLLLQNGTIYDGSGGPALRGDVAVAGERIVAVGSFPAGEAERVVDCTGLVIAPGFIDLHTHSDRSIVEEATRDNLNYLTQGCTTVVTGNCGSGPEETAAYFETIERHGAGTHVIHLVPHGAVRHAVMQNSKRAPTAGELQRMKRLVDEAMRQGAWGLSTGLIYIPGCYAEADELVELAKVVARHGGIYASHIRNEGARLCESVREALEIGRRAGVPVHISHFKASGIPNWGRLREAVQLIEQARRAGQKVTADQYPYTASSTSLAATLLPESALPGGRADLFPRMKKDPAFARQVRKLIRRRLDHYEDVMIDSCQMPQYNGRRLKRIAAREGIDIVELVLKIHRAGSAYTVNFSMCEEDVRYGMQLPWVATASDGRARRPDPDTRCHPRNFGTFPRKVGRYAHRLKVITMEHAIRSATGLPADILGLVDRGYLRPGAVADIVVFDPDQFIDRATFDDPHQYSTGVRYLFIAGQLALQDSKRTGKLHGRLLRHRPTAARRPPAPELRVDRTRAAVFTHRAAAAAHEPDDVLGAAGGRFVAR